jgi:hypothetical protein
VKTFDFVQGSSNDMKQDEVTSERASLLVDSSSRTCFEASSSSPTLNHNKQSKGHLDGVSPSSQPPDMRLQKRLKCRQAWRSIRPLDPIVSSCSHNCNMTCKLNQRYGRDETGTRPVCQGHPERLSCMSGRHSCNETATLIVLPPEAEKEAGEKSSPRRNKPPLCQEVASGPEWMQPRRFVTVQLWWLTPRSPHEITASC